MVEKSNPALFGSFVVWYSEFFVRIRSFSISQRFAQQSIKRLHMHYASGMISGQVHGQKASWKNGCFLAEV